MPADGPVVWHAPMAVKLLQDFLVHVDWYDLDYLLIDMPPGTGDVQLTMAQGAGLTASIVVTTPQQVAMGVARKGLKMFEQVKVPILGVVENMAGYVCSKCGHHEDIFLASGGKTLAAEAHTAFLGSLPLDPAVVKSGDEGVPVTAGDSDAPAAKAYRALAETFEREVARLNGRVTDAPKSIALDDEGSLRVVWADGSTTTLGAYHLRLSCPCAVCVDEHTGKKLLDDKRVPLDVKIKEVHPVGSYGLTPIFTDGHGTGIFTFERVKKLSETLPGGETLHLS
jgi:ATP-binding protein involved in chromosome partitioning